MGNIRFRAAEQANSRRIVRTEAPAPFTSGYYGCSVFRGPQAEKYLSPEAVKELAAASDGNAALDRDAADEIADGMRRWAMDLGATHYTHWFHPLTGGTAEKHDAFSEPDGKGGSMETFSGKLLVQQEPDASSFPSGGLRNTFEARGYTAWDPSSPAFVVGDTLCIPTVFISYNGEALDHKTPLLRSISAIDRAAAAVCGYFDKNVKKVTSYLGWEQEYFLADRSLFMQRPDLMLTGRTLMGHESAKSQQLEDHYFSSIPARVMAFMRDLETECYKLAIPIKTRHNEVAPNQFEFAPVYEEMNLAVDHNLLLMSLMKKVARRHNFKVLLHEKPFKGINGSGKHCNWSLGTDTGVNLMAPGKSESDHLRFMTFMINVLTAVYRNNGLIKASIASASNSHRLGANEAPPAIMSSFLGDQIFSALSSLGNSDGAAKMNGRTRKLNIPQIPEILMDNTDRNRTSPFAFTGNRFEFRAVGSSANCAMPMTVLNAVVADQLMRFKEEVDSKLGKMNAEEAIISTLRGYAKECRNICFDGNGYSDEWKKEAKRRKLDTETSVPLIYDHFVSNGSKKIFANTGILSEIELDARNEVWWELYGKKIEIEARVLGDLASNHVLPVATEYQSMLLDNVCKMRTVFGEKADELAKCQMRMIENISDRMSSVRRLGFEMSSLSEELSMICDKREKAVGYHDKVLPYLETIRSHIDELEMIVDDRIWPLPKYRELLFSR